MCRIVYNALQNHPSDAECFKSDQWCLYCLEVTERILLLNINKNLLNNPTCEDISVCKLKVSQFIYQFISDEKDSTKASDIKD